MADEKKVPDSNRIAELWLAIKTLLAGKVDVETLGSYPTITAVSSSIASALSDYAKNDSVEELINDALVDYMTTSEVNDAILKAIKSAATFKKEVVDVLPEVWDDNTIYLVPSDNPSEKDSMIEYIFVNGEPERIGATTADLTNYWSKDEIRIMTSKELEDILNGI